jgi:gamma-glutamylcyclotransferase (GGCT)/AIG2-like uncharacterized protein YtfP
MQSEYLFVYGTLLKDFDSYMSKFLDRNSEFIGRGYFNGKLFEISWYPGAVLSEDVSEKVYGHVIRILDKSKTFKILDDYEGIGDSIEHPNEYKRVLIEAYLDSKETINSWVYIYNLPTTSLKLIASGNYLKQ